ncbi:MAG: PEGA domain-containing protein [Myxococcota bacterium]
MDKPRPAPGFLTLVALPFAQVLLGSQDLGPTPLHKTQLPAGKHRLRLIGENGQQYVLPVEISSGETTKLKVMLEELDPG